MRWGGAVRRGGAGRGRGWVVAGLWGGGEVGGGEAGERQAGIRAPLAAG